MRKIDRNVVPPPPSLTGEDCSGSKELVAARSHYATAAKESFSFAAYTGADVLDALEQLFHGKCAYCESKIAAVSPADVEHFRPKGAVEQCHGHRGYWWLAARWDNLLASCIHCNRSRGHRHFEPGVSLAILLEREKTVSGKADSFPIGGPSHARNEHDSLEDEDPLLIDPTSRDPSRHLVWRFDGDLSFVSPREDDGGHDVYGWATAHTFGLNRQGLVESRTSVLLGLRVTVSKVEEMLDAAVTLPDPGSGLMRDFAMDIFFSLQRTTESDQPYSSMSSLFLAAEADRLMEKYSALV